MSRQMDRKIPEVKEPDKVKSYFRLEWQPLLIVTVTGIIYNIGMTAGPWFEGQLAQMLWDIMAGKKQTRDMIVLALFYMAVILFVQAMRYAKRFYVRRFANNVGRNMKHVLYCNLVHKSKAELSSESVGSLMTKTISDVDTCVEGMRKFTTEVFDTGVVLAAYLVMLFYYDWRLALLVNLFPPIAYIIAERLKKTVSRCAAAYKESAGRLSTETLDRISGALTYRVLGSDAERNRAYEERLADYEKKAVYAGILETTLQPLYYIISMVSVIFIVWFGAKNIRGNGWADWNIAAFTTFLACYTKLAAKSSKAAKLFNAVQKARVSWTRIKPMMHPVPDEYAEEAFVPGKLTAKNVSCAYPGSDPVLHSMNFTADPGEWIGVTGPVACGKSSLGKMFLDELTVEGTLRYDGREWKDLTTAQKHAVVGYMGHDPELISDTLAENILLGKVEPVGSYIEAVCLTEETESLPKKEETMVGSGGVRFSGGQQARIALARTLCYPRPLMILDDPFSALDRRTEEQVFANMKACLPDSTVLLISHRLYLFPELDKVIWIENGSCIESTHEELYRTCAHYRELYDTQMGGDLDAE